MIAQKNIHSPKKKKPQDTLRFYVTQRLAGLDAIGPILLTY